MPSKSETSLKIAFYKSCKKSHKMNEISIGMRSPNANSDVNSWAPIKPSLYIIKSDVMSKKVVTKG